MKAIVAAAIFAFSVCGHATGKAPGKGIWISHGFVTGNDYLALPALTQNGYLYGFVDGVMISPLLGAPERPWMDRCIHSGFNFPQLKAIVDKFMRDHPERWDEDMSSLTFSAVAEACKPRGFAPK